MLSVHNPATLGDEDFLRGFVARQAVATRLIGQLGKISQTSVARHHLLVGQRGMGKTSMLRRIAIAATVDEQLNRVLIPLSFREEQYNVHSFYVFWINCLDALGDWFDRSGQPTKAEQLDREVAALSGAPDSSFALFNRWIAQENRRALLLLDNIDLIFNGLKKDRALLIDHMRAPGGVVIVGASTSMFTLTSESGTDVSDIFEVTRLDRLGRQELIACLRSLALARGSDGEKVLRLVESDAARIRTLYDLTGGNPRTLTLLYLLLETDSQGDVFNDLERLLDQVTVLYKARVEDVPAQARVVLDAVALAWNPALASEIASTTLLEVTAVSSQLDRLQKDGVIERVTVSKTTKGAYQITERFFNIWYLMRHGPRRQRSRLRWLTAFLRSFYTHAELLERAKMMLVNSGAELGADGGDLLLALSDAIDDEDWRSLLKNHARIEFEKYACSLGLSLDQIVDPSDVPKPTTAGEWIRHGNLLRQHLKRSKEAEAAFVTSLSLEPGNFGGWFNLGSVRLGDLADSAGAIEALNHALKVKPEDLATHYMLGEAYVQAGSIALAEQTYLACLKLNPSFYLASVALGDLYTNEGRFAEADIQFRLVAKLAAKKNGDALHSAAFFSGYFAENFDRALRLFAKELTLKPDDLVARTNFAVLKQFGTHSGPLPNIDSDLLLRHPAYAQALIKALGFMCRGDHATALSLVPSIFEANEQQIFSNYRGFVLLLFRGARRQGWGQALLDALDKTGASDRHWPLRAAYEGYLFGEQRLLDVNPEVRPSAQKIMSFLKAPEIYQSEVVNRENLDDELL